MEQKNFNKLTPIDTANIDAYKGAFDFAFSDSKIRNIAITGGYGSGKSSVIETYKKNLPNQQNNKLEFLHITLANFETLEINKKKDKTAPEKSSDTDEKVEKSQTKSSHSEIDERNMIEGKILNHIVHKLEEEQIDKSGISVRKSISELDVKYKLAQLSFIVLYFIGLLNIDHFKLISDNWFVRIMATIGFVAILACFLYPYILKYIRNPIIKRISTKDCSIEIIDKKDNSYFNKYLDDLLFLLTVTKYNVFVFEDMDRFGNIEIFEVLREINDLVNSKLSASKSNKNVKFVYVMRDGLFSSTDRVKFFDFIIPIVPVIHNSNSRDFLLKELETYINLKSNAISRKFINEIAIFLSDLRLLYNICNEFKIYETQLSGLTLPKEKLFSIILYKNLAPTDFEDLLNGKGFLFDIINQTKEIKKAKYDILTNKINELIKQKSQDVINEYELEANYFVSPYNYSINNANKKYESNAARMKDLIETFNNNPNAITLGNGVPGPSQHFINDINNMRANSEYILKKQNIEAFVNNTKEQLGIKIKELSDERENISSRNLNEIIDSKTLDEKLDKKDANFGQAEKNLVKYLITTGNIDERYENYISCFHAEGISLNDKIFVMSIYERDSKGYRYRLNSPRNVIEALNPAYLNCIEALNFDLLAYLLNEKRELLKVVFNYIVSNKQFDFIISFLRTNIANTSSINWIFDQDSKIWEAILDQEIPTQQDFSYLILESLSHLSSDRVKIALKNERIINFINKDNKFLKDALLSIAFDNLENIGINFEKIDFASIEISNIDEVYCRNLYAINSSNIEEYLVRKYEILRTDINWDEIISVISTNKNQNLYKRFLKDPQLFIKLAIENCSGGITDTDNVIEEILNLDTIDIETKEEYVLRISTELQSIDSIKDLDLWPILLSHKAIVYNEFNVLAYFKNVSEVCIDVALTEFINEGKTCLDFSKVDSDKNFDCEVITDFYKSVILLNNISLQKFDEILVKCPLAIEDMKAEITCDGYDLEKINILIKNKIIKMNETNLIEIREIYPDYLVYFIENNIGEYTKILVDGVVIATLELQQVLESKNILDKGKLAILGKTDMKIEISGMNYPENVEIHIINNNYQETDAEYVINSFNNRSEIYRDSVYDKITQNIDEYVAQKRAFTKILYLRLMNDVKLDLTVKEAILINSIKHIDKEEILKSLKILGFNSLFFLIKNAPTTHNILNKEIPAATALQEIGLIGKIITKNSGNTQAYSIKKRSQEPLKINLL